MGITGAKISAAKNALVGALASLMSFQIGDDFNGAIFSRFSASGSTANFFFKEPAANAENKIIPA